MRAKHRQQVIVADGLRGQGVFARTAFRPAEVIGRIAGEVIRNPEYSSSYCIELEDSVITMKAGRLSFSLPSP